MPGSSVLQQAIIPGIYRHFKGQRYQVLGQVRHSETRQEMVLYRALYGDFSLWVRPISMFVEQVEVEGHKQPRFVLLQAQSVNLLLPR